MDAESKRKILGAFFVGFALVAGAYTLGNIEGPRYQQPAAVLQPEVPPRQAIEVVDTDGNGIEDWRDDFVTTQPVILTETTEASYEPPETLTGRTGVNFIQSVLERRIYIQNPDTDQQVIDATINQLETETSGVLYDPTDIAVIMEWEEADIANYGNIMGNSITFNNPSGVASELTILEDVLRRENFDRVEELNLIADYYVTLRDEALNTPVPRILAKEHLDLINTYHAIAIDVNAMSQVLEDPLIALMRMRQYEDNALGLQLALENMYLGLLPYQRLFAANDPAVTFVLFAPEQRI